MLGTNPPAAMAGLQQRRRQCALFGSLGPVYVFRESIGSRAVSQLASRGGSYVPSYGVSPARSGGDAERAGGGGASSSAAGPAAAADRGGVGHGVSGSGKKLAAVGRGLGAAAKAVAKAATSKGHSSSSPASASSSSSKKYIIDAITAAETDGGYSSSSSSSSSLAAAAQAMWAALDAELGPALLQVLHPAAVPPSGRRVPDLSPAGSGGRGDRHGRAVHPGSIKTRV